MLHKNICIFLLEDILQEGGWTQLLVDGCTFGRPENCPRENLSRSLLTVNNNPMAHDQSKFRNTKKSL